MRTVAGDFNGNAIWDAAHPKATHTMAVDLLADCGLASAYHRFCGEKHGHESRERATHYHTWNKERPFHIDYCFVPRRWVNGLHEVSVGSYDDLAELSDHRPIVVDIDESLLLRADQSR